MDAADEGKGGDASVCSNNDRYFRAFSFLLE